MDNEKVYQWKSRWPIILAGGMIVTIGLVLTIPDLIIRGLVALGPLILLLAVGAFTLSQVWKKLRSNRLVLSDAGLRRVSVYGEYFVPWKEMRLLKIRKNRKGEVRGIIAVSAQGKRILLAGFEGMDEIAAFIQSHATTPQPDTPIADALSKPYIAGLISFVGLAGMALVALSEDGSEMKEAGYTLLAVSVVPMLWLYRNNMITTLGSKTAWKYWGRSALIKIGFTLAMVALLLLIVLVIARNGGAAK